MWGGGNYITLSTSEPFEPENVVVIIGYQSSNKYTKMGLCTPGLKM